MRTERVLGSRVDIIDRKEAVEKVLGMATNSRGSKLRLVVTAYSEFYVMARKDEEFRSILNDADLVVPDGVSVLGAVEYAQRIKNSKNQIKNLLAGLGVGVDILRGRVGESVTGVYLFEELTRLAAEKGFKVFLLGSKPGVAKKVADDLRIKNYDLRIEYDEGEQRVGGDPVKAREVIEKINKFQPDLLFVAYNPINQEKWLWKHAGELKVKVGMGVGGTFDECVGLVPAAPSIMSRMGLKWLWRLIVQPSRLSRILRAFPYFPWLVFRESIR